MGAASGLGWGVIWRENKCRGEVGLVQGVDEQLDKIVHFCVYIPVCCVEYCTPFCVFFMCADGTDLFVLQNEHIYRSHFLTFFLIPCTFHTLFFPLCDIWIEAHIIHDKFSFYSQHFKKKGFRFIAVFLHRQSMMEWLKLYKYFLLLWLCKTIIAEVGIFHYSLTASLWSFNTSPHIFPNPSVLSLIARLGKSKATSSA